MTDTVEKPPAARRFGSFSLRELCLLMLTVAAFAGWWRAMPKRGLPNYSKISRAAIEKALDHAAKEHFSKHNTSYRFGFPTGSNGSNLDESSNSSRFARYEIFYAVESKKPGVFLIPGGWRYTSGDSEASPLQKDLLESLKQELESMHDFKWTSSRNGGDGSSCAGGERLLTTKISYETGELQGTVFLSVKEISALIAREEEKETLLRNDRMEVEVILVEVPIVARK